MLIQSQKKDCGKTVVRNLLALFFHSTNFYTCELKSDCESFYSIRKELEYHGIYYVSYHVDDIEDIKKNMFPLICQMIEGDYYHFVIVDSINEHHVEVRDPNYGTFSLNIKEFLNSFTGKFMALSKIDKKEKTSSISLLSFRMISLYLLCFSVEAISLVSLLLFSSSSNSYLFCILSLTAFLLFILFQNSYNLMLRHHLEQKYILNDKRINREDYQHLYTLITMTIRYASNTLSYAVFCIGLSTLLLLNSYYFSFLLLVGILFYCLRFPLHEERNAVNRYCSLKEAIFLEKKQDKEGQKAFLSMRKRSELLLSSYLISYLLEFFSLGIFAFSIMSVTGSFSINRFVYSILLTMSFSFSLEKMMKLFHYPEEKAKEINTLSFPLL